MNNEIIKSLYKKFKRQPSDLDGRHLDLLCDNIVDQRGIELDDDCLVFTDMTEDAPLRRIRLDHIYGVQEIGGWLAIVLHSSILFFHPQTLQTQVHLR